jgi:hypothetical protein
MNKVKKLVVSLPFERLIGQLSRDEIKSWIDKYQEIILIGPYDLIIGDINLYSNEKNFCINKFTLTILKISEYVRRYGFYYKYRKDFPYENYNLTFAKISTRKYKFPMFTGIVIKIGMIVGSNPVAWKILRELSFIRFTNYYKALKKLLCKGDIDSLQYAQWGVQDAVLSILIDRFSQKKILQTYSTDQCINGYLYLHYDSVILQGIKEYKYLNTFQKNNFSNYFIKNNRKAKIEAFLKKSDIKNKDTILICGAHKNFYPRTDEVIAVKNILSKTDLLSRYKVIYRPLVDTPEEMRFIESKLIEQLKEPYFAIEKPSISLTGLSNSKTKLDYGEAADVEQNYFALLASCKIVISFIATSLLIDAEKMGSYVCSYVDTDSIFHKHAGTRLMFSERSINIYEGIDRYDSLGDLLAALKNIEYLRPNKKLIENWS